MDTLLNPDAVIGNNNPPDQLLEEANERIDAANKWLTERPEITDDEIADKAGGFKAQLAATFKALDERRLAENRAHLAAQDAKYKTPLALLKAGLDAVDAKIRAYLKAKQDRLDEERRKQEAAAKAAQEAAAAAAKKAEEEASKKGGDPLRAQLAADQAKEKAAQAAQAAAAPAERAAIKGTYTQRAVTLKTYWSARIVDETAALKAYAKHPDIRAAALAAILKIAKDDAVATKDPAKAKPGIEYFSEQR
jgi:hypothetical protein